MVSKIIGVRIKFLGVMKVWRPVHVWLCVSTIACENASAAQRLFQLTFYLLNIHRNTLNKKRTVLWQTERRSTSYEIRLLRNYNVRCIAYESPWLKPVFIEVQSSPIITISVYTAPRQYRQILCGTSLFLTVNHNIIPLCSNNTLSWRYNLAGLCNVNTRSCCH